MYVTLTIFPWIRNHLKTQNLNSLQIVGCVAELRELASGDSKVTAKFLLYLRDSQHLISKSTTIHFPEGFESQFKEDINTISSTRSDQIRNFGGVTENAAAFSPKLVPSSATCASNCQRKEQIIVKQQFSCRKSIFYLLKRSRLVYSRIKLTGQGGGTS